VKPRSSSASDLPKKTVSPERALILPPVFDSDKYEALSVQPETVHLNGFCTIDHIKTPLDTLHELSKDVAVLKCDNAWFKTQINRLHEKVGQPEGSLSFRVGLQADKEIADTSTAAPRRNPARSYAAVADSGSGYTSLPSKEFAD
jgi:hypothetical protein